MTGLIGERIVVRATSKVVALMVAMILGGIPPFADLDRGRAQQQPVPERSARDAALVRTRRYRFEVFCYTSGVRVFASDPAGAALNASTLEGTATFHHPNSLSPWFTRTLRPDPTRPGHPSESLDLAIDLGDLPQTGVTVTFAIAGLPDPEEPTAKFTVPFAPVAGGPGSARAVQAAPTYRISAEQVHFFPAAGYYRTSSGVTIWVPSPGYYHGTPVQFHQRVQPAGASGWQPAHPAIDPSRSAIARAVVAPELSQTELYWRPRASHESVAYQAYIRGQMRQQHAVVRSPSIADRECAKCHQR
jgi:hypothetical protein